MHDTGPSAQEAGADHVLDHQADTAISASVRELTDGRGVDVVDVVDVVADNVRGGRYS